jgi:hypothetical protein
MTGRGQEEPFSPLTLSARYVIRQETLTEAHGNGRAASKAGIQVSMLFVRADHLFQSRPDRA